MHLNAATRLKRPGMLHRLTGLAVTEFERVLPAFPQA
jgi:hypothetical protein